MTRREYMEKHHPECIREGIFSAGVLGCPYDYPDLLKLDPRVGNHCAGLSCVACWNKAIPEAEVTTETPVPIRAKILSEASNIVCNDRNKQYGEPEDNFETIASLWNPYLSAQLGQEVHLDGADVGMLMTLFKCGRIMSGQAKRDNFVDAAGYIACAAGIALKEETK